MTTSLSDTTDGKCPFLEHCTLILNHESRMPNLIQRIKGYYCTKHISQCARGWIYDTLGARYVPPLLLPNQWQWARDIACDQEDESNDNNPKSENPIHNKNRQ